MKKLLLNLILFAVISLPNVMAQTTTKSSEVLTNSRIQELNSKGLSSSIIVSKINESSCAFDVSTDELIRLKEKKVPDEVVYAMIESMKSPKEEEANPNKPAYSQGSGIYYHSLGDDHEQMIYLEP